MYLGGRETTLHAVCAGVDANGARTGYGELDEYESPYDIGFTRDYVEDQAGFITQELDLPEEQQAYLLMKLGLLGNNSESEESAGEEAQEELPTDDDELQELLDAAAQVGVCLVAVA